MPLKVGEALPPAKFRYIAYTPENSDIVACGAVEELDAQKEFKGKKVVLFAVPGAFTPGCQVKHLPPFVEKYAEFKNKGVDIVAVISANDAYVLSAWTKANNAGDKILGLSDADAKFSKSIGWEKDLSSAGMGMRTARYAIVLDDLKVVYAEREPAGNVTVSSAEAVLAKL